MRTLAVVSLHTSPLTQPGTGDSGGMNVYVRELVAALSQAGVAANVYVRAWADDLAHEVEVESGFRVVHVPAGPPSLAKEQLPDIVEPFSNWVRQHIEADGSTDAIHANYAAALALAARASFPKKLTPARKRELSFWCAGPIANSRGYHALARQRFHGAVESIPWCESPA